MSRWARRLICACSFLVPSHRRRDWLEEWTGELDALMELGAAPTRGSRTGPSPYPGPLRFALGALPQALWTQKAEWTLDSIAQDIRFALRVLRRAPGFSVAAALTLALGIGVNGTIFSLVNSLLFQAPPGIVEPNRLVQIARSYDDAPRWDNWSWPATRLIDEQSNLLTGVAGFTTSSFLLGRGEDTQPAMGQYVSARYFDLLGVVPALGRLIGPQDETAPLENTVAVLSHGLWMRRFGGDPGVIGRTLAVGGIPYEIIGVVPAQFAGVESIGSRPDLWVPIMQRFPASDVGRFESWGSSWVYTFGRLHEGVSYEAAEASMDGITASLRAASDINEDIRVLMAPGVGLSPGERAEAKQITYLLMGIALLVLILTCANVGNLFLARATTREPEMNVRRALGAGRSRLTRQLITESLILGLVATAIAVPLVVFLNGLLPSVVPFRLTNAVSPDTNVFIFLGVVGLFSGFLFGTAPAWTLSRATVAKSLRDAGTTGGPRRTLLRDALVVGQLAISLGLVSGAALLGRSVMNVYEADPGFDPEDLYVGFVNLRATGRYEGAAVAEFQERLLRELEATPGLEGVALAGQAPILGGHSRSTVRPLESRDDLESGYEAEFTVITPEYFDALGISLIRGRSFLPPAREPERVVIVNQALAERFWPGQDPIGKTLLRGENTMRVVGLVADVQMRSLRTPANPGVYYPYHQEEQSYFAVHAKTQGTLASTLPALRTAVANVDSEVPLTGVVNLREGLATSLSETRTFGYVVTAFAGLALVLSLLGLYGLVSYGVAQRNRELGIRLALGAPRAELINLILIRGMALSGVGLLLGLGLAVGIGRSLEGVLYGVGATYLPALVASTAVLFLAGLLAAWIPARRASRVDAVVSLRE